MKTTRDIRYAAFGPDTLDVYLPEERVKACFVYFHGGGLEAGDKKDAEIFAPVLTEKSYAVISANYRMYPDAHYPDYLEDAALAAAYAVNRFGDVPVYLGGSSAGGYISMMLCFDDRYLAGAGLAPDAIAGYVHDAGQPTTHFNVLRERGLDTRRVLSDEAAPIWHVGLKQKLSPMFVIWSDRDMENRPEQTELLLSTMRHFRLDMDRVFTHKMTGTHCAYVGRVDDDGKSAMGKLLLEAFGRFEGCR